MGIGLGHAPSRRGLEGCGLRSGKYKHGRDSFKKVVFIYVVGFLTLEPVGKPQKPFLCQFVEF